jgi:hypothetical protein
MTNLNEISIGATCNKHIISKHMKSFCKIDGEWTNFLNFNNVTYWRAEDYEPIPIHEGVYTLPSDSTLRLDLNFHIEGDETNAQLHKEKLEEIQRTERKLRESYYTKKK